MQIYLTSAIFPSTKPPFPVLNTPITRNIKWSNTIWWRPGIELGDNDPRQTPRVLSIRPHCFNKTMYKTFLSHCLMPFSKAYVSVARGYRTSDSFNWCLYDSLVWHTWCVRSAVYIHTYIEVVCPQCNSVISCQWRYYCKTDYSVKLIEDCFALYNLYLM